MNIHDKTMCGWSMLDTSENKEIWDNLYNHFKKNVVEIVQ